MGPYGAKGPMGPMGPMVSKNGFLGWFCLKTTREGCMVTKNAFHGQRFVQENPKMFKNVTNLTNLGFDHFVLHVLYTPDLIK